MGAMIALSGQMPDMEVGSACFGIADILSEYGDKIDTDAERRLLVLGAALWRKSQQLEELATVHHVHDAGPAGPQ